jgi:hypothetical protein
MAVKMNKNSFHKPWFSRWLLPGLIAVFIVFIVGTGYLAYKVLFAEPDVEQVFPKYAQPKDMATAQLEQALKTAINRHPDVLAYLIYRISISNVTYSEDKNTALLWLSLYEKETDTLLPAEPGLAISRKNTDGSWTVTVQTDEEFRSLLQQIPDSMIDPETRGQYLSDPQPLAKGVEPLRGYKLPWKKGVTKFLTGSIGHVLTYKSCPSSCMYAFDFADGGNFPILAAKGGYVKYAVWKYPDNNHDNANYIILEDPTTNPVTYQVYFHLSQDTIPVELRTKGAWVNQGQFIGNVDNTGYSSGPHLHFHVHANPTTFWGNSVDIVFEYVSVNGGRPRTCTEASAFPAYGNQCMHGNKYTSNNGDSKPPTGVLSSPTANTLVTTSSVAISGYGSDESGISNIQPMVKYDGFWRAAGPKITTEAFVADLDLCAAGVPNGQVSIGLNIWDKGGNKTLSPVSEVSIRKQFACPEKPPACEPGDGQVAIYNNAKYQGYCQVLPVGDIPDMSTLIEFGENNLESIQVGANTHVLLFDEKSFKGRSQTLSASSSDLDNQPVGANRVSSLSVLKSIPAPNIPMLNPVTGANGATLTSDNTVFLSWQPSNGAAEYHAEVTGPENYSSIQDWQVGLSYTVGTLKPGNYQWTVFARNSSGERSASGSFSVNSGTNSLPSSIASPYEAVFSSNEAGWTATGSWQRGSIKLGSNSHTGWIFGNGSSYARVGSPASGDLTSPPIKIGYGGQILTFQYAALTESNGNIWDQRKVLISVDDGQFTDLPMTIAGNSESKLLESQPLDLTPYTGKTIRLRFHFNTVDEKYNDGLGWAITTVRISDDPAKVCTENTDDGKPEMARPIMMGSVVDAQICPTGDVDFYNLTGLEKQAFSATMNITSPVTGWRPSLTLIGSDGVTTIAESKLSGNSAQINTILPKTDHYYLKVVINPPEKPGVPGVDYRLSLIQDTVPPSVKLTKPENGNISIKLPISLAAEASDTEGSVSRVEFFIQPTGVSADKAERVGLDENGVDGWTGSIPEGYPGNLVGSALFARAFDQAGNHSDSSALVLAGDSQIPITRLEPLSEETGSSMIRLRWSVSSASKVEHFELQYRQGGGEWRDLATPLDAKMRETSFFARNGVEYGFRMRAIAGDESEEFPAEAQAVTRIEDECEPDKFEPSDNKPSGSSALQTGNGQIRNFCGLQDIDWSSMLLQGQKSYEFKAIPLDLPAGAALQLFDTAGNPLSDEVFPENLSSETVLYYKPETSGTYLLRARAADDHLAGTKVIYTLKYDQASPFAPFPIICGAFLIPLLTALLKLWGAIRTGLGF